MVKVKTAVLAKYKLPREQWHVSPGADGEKPLSATVGFPSSMRVHVTPTFDKVGGKRRNNSDKGLKDTSRTIF